jgi:hypothetical protein
LLENIFKIKKKKVMVGLTETHHTRLKAHFGNGYLGKSLEDIETFQHDSIVLDLLLPRDPTLIDTPVQRNPEEINQALNLINVSFSELWDNASQTIQTIGWKTIVELKTIPSFLDPVISVLIEITKSSGKRLIRLIKSILKKGKEIWEYISSLLQGIIPIDIVNSEGEFYGLSGLVKLYEQAGTLISSTIYNITSGILSILKWVQKLIGSAVDSMAQLSTSLFEILYNGTVDTTKRFVIKNGMFILMSLNDLTRYATQAAKNKTGSIYNEKVKSFGRKYSSITIELFQYVKELGRNAINSIQDTNLFKMGYGVLLKGVDLVTWIISYFPWLSKVLKQIGTASYSIMKSLLYISTLLSEMFSSMFAQAALVKDQFEKQDTTLFGLMKTAQKYNLSERVPEKVKPMLQEAINVTEEYMDNTNEYQKSRARNLWNASDKQVHELNDTGAELVASILLDDENDIDVDKFKQFTKDYNGHSLLTQMELYDIVKKQLVWQIMIAQFSSEVYTVHEITKVIKGFTAELVENDIVSLNAVNAIGNDGNNIDDDDDIDPEDEDWVDARDKRNNARFILGSFLDVYDQPTSVILKQAQISWNYTKALEKRAESLRIWRKPVSITKEEVIEQMKLATETQKDGDYLISLIMDWVESERVYETIRSKRLNIKRSSAIRKPVYIYMICMSVPLLAIGVYYMGWMPDFLSVPIEKLYSFASSETGGWFSESFWRNLTEQQFFDSDLLPGAVSGSLNTVYSTFFSAIYASFSWTGKLIENPLGFMVKEEWERIFTGVASGKIWLWPQLMLMAFNAKGAYNMFISLFAIIISMPVYLSMFVVDIFSGERWDKSALIYLKAWGKYAGSRFVDTIIIFLQWLGAFYDKSYGVVSSVTGGIISIGRGFFNPVSKTSDIINGLQQFVAVSKRDQHIRSQLENTRNHFRQMGLTILIPVPIPGMELTDNEDPEQKVISYRGLNALLAAIPREDVENMFISTRKSIKIVSRQKILSIEPPLSKKKEEKKKRSRRKPKLLKF